MNHPRLAFAAALAIAALPVGLAATSPYLAFRSWVYIAAGFAGILAMALLIFQPLLAGRLLPGLSLARARAAHRWVGGTVVGLLIAHVAGLWITSPPDVADAFLLRSPTPFSLWGVIAFWATLCLAVLAVLRRRIPPRLWQRLHLMLASLVATTTIAHAALVQGTMEPFSKALLSAALLAALIAALATLWRRGRRSSS